MTSILLRTSAFAYTRVSSKGQERNGNSLADQRLAIDAFATHDETDIVEWFEDVGSAYGSNSIARRPQFQAMVKKAEALGLPIIVSRFDRLSRDTQSFLNMIKNRKLTFISAEEGLYLTEGNLKAQIERSQSENKRRSDSTKAEHARRKAEGRPPRNANLGSARQKSASVRSKNAQDTADHLASLLRSDASLNGLSLQKLADRLAQLGHYDLRGKPWTKSAVRAAMLRLKEVQIVSAGDIADPAEELRIMQRVPFFGMF